MSMGIIKNKIYCPKKKGIEGRFVSAAFVIGYSGIAINEERETRFP